MNDYYVYQYLNEDGSPFYIGKGKDRRINMPHLVDGKNILPKKNRRVMIAEEMSERDSLELEAFIIQEIGREVDGGTLINVRCRGRESKQVFNEETRAKMRDAKLGIPRSEETKAKMSVAHLEHWKTYDSTERDKKISKALKGRVIGCNLKSQQQRKHDPVLMSLALDAKKKEGCPIWLGILKNVMKASKNMLD